VNRGIRCGLVPAVRAVFAAPLDDEYGLALERLVDAARTAARQQLASHAAPERAANRPPPGLETAAVRLGAS
jgi:hypothetical protein